jgi:hypothetical protein
MGILGRIPDIRVQWKRRATIARGIQPRPWMAPCLVYRLARRWNTTPSVTDRGSVA